MKGLIIKPYWADLILNGKKTWEIRGSNTNIRGVVAIIKSGTGMIYGTAELIDTKRLSPLDMHYYFDKHRVTDEVTYSNAWAWVLDNAKYLPEPTPYKHPQGAVIWVNLDKEVAS